MADIEFGAAIPVLPSLDIGASVSFYTEKMGFSVAFRYPDYAGFNGGRFRSTSGAARILRSPG